MHHLSGAVLILQVSQLPGLVKAGLAQQIKMYTATQETYGELNRCGRARVGTKEETLSSRFIGKREGPGEVAGGSAVLDDHLQPAPEELWIGEKKSTRDLCCSFLCRFMSP